MRNYLAPLVLATVAACSPTGLKSEGVEADNGDHPGLAEALETIQETKAILIAQIGSRYEGVDDSPISNGSRMSATQCAIGASLDSAQKKAYDDARRTVADWFARNSIPQGPQSSARTTGATSPNFALACSVVYGYEPTAVLPSVLHDDRNAP